jgi:hypothetical protein
LKALLSYFPFDMNILIKKAILHQNGFLLLNPRERIPRQLAAG